MGVKLVIRIIQVFRHNSDITQYRHEIGITIPPGDYVEMEMLLNTGASYFPLINPDIKTVRVKTFSKDSLRFPE